MITVINGANETELGGFVGQSVAAVRAAFAGLGVTATQAATINGRRAADTDTLSDGDELVFVAELAQKG